MHYTYVIFSPTYNVFYKGYTTDVPKRLNEHNNDLGRYTAGKGPWNLIVVEQHESKTKALQRERMLKKQKADYFLWLQRQPGNLAHLFQNTQSGSSVG
jgi:putative endonuclease